MRHRVAGRELGRTSEHRLAMRRNTVASLFEHETISTTIEKAKEVKPFAEKLITLAKQGTLTARRRAISLLGNRNMVGSEDGEVKGTVIGKLFSELGPRYLDRPGGYTRIVRLSMRRLGDNGQLALLQLVGKESAPEKDSKTASKGTRKKAAKTPKAQETPKEEQSSNNSSSLRRQCQISKEDCIFCKMIHGLIPITKIYEDEVVIAFLDIGPLNDGHTLVIPKQHFEKLDDCPAELLGEVASRLGKIPKAVVKAISSQGYNLLCNNGQAAGQKVKHLHFHIIPRNFGDRVFDHWPAYKYPEGKIEKIAASIRANF